MLSLEEKEKIIEYIIANERQGDKALSHTYKSNIEKIVNSLTLDDLFEIDDLIMSKLSSESHNK